MLNVDVVVLLYVECLIAKFECRRVNVESWIFNSELCFFNVECLIVKCSLSHARFK